ncbi:MAG: Asp-tRNA(Asn)/Glu-tRNA(Gln) amidotransferase subunit GatB [Candidatus Shapirobacteria bacterium]|nr:Asp-tRNA(Asn)/Glu-tRNA(Gln) amidotransferase subunit GatB [Candidatus Shapirobacteria bacterium]
MKITPIIGLEVHVELKTKSKMFCSCDAQHFHIEPNTHTCPVCLGLPGALPVPNKTACEWCIKLGLALNCTPNKISFFERKNYFYPDLPKGYQITQLEKPFVVNGFIEIDGQKIRINRAHMEEDTGKSVHTNENGVDITLIDYNRSSVPLVEIVSEPDITSAELAKKYLLKIQQIIRYLGISDADIEKGSMRCEPTINLKIEDNEQTFYTPLVEVKNVASLTGVQNAIQFEIDRQAEEFKKTGEEKSKTNKTTRGWDADKNQTFLQREKEGSSDYRYFPEPDIPYIIFTDEQIEEIRKTIPELPDQKIARYKSELGLNNYDASQIAENKAFADIYENAISLSLSPDFAKFNANLFLGAIKTYLNENNKELDKSKINPQFFFDLFTAVSKSKISSTVAKQVIIESCQTGDNPVEIAKSKGLIQVSDSGEIEKLGKEVITANPKAVEDYKKNPASIGFLIGQLMKASKGSANPQLAKEILEKLLK